MVFATLYIWQDVSNTHPPRLRERASKSEVVDVPAWHGGCVVNCVPISSSDIVVFHHKSKFDVIACKGGQVKLNVGPSTWIESRNRGSTQCVFVVLYTVATTIDFVVRSLISNLIIPRAEGESTGILNVDVKMIPCCSWVEYGRRRCPNLNVCTVCVTIGWICSRCRQCHQLMERIEVDGRVFDCTR